MTERPHHLLTVWNPTYSDDALDAHLSVLLDWAHRRDVGEAEPDDVYVWWGRIRSKNREGRLPHHERVLAVDAQAEGGTETTSGSGSSTCGGSSSTIRPP